MLTRLLLPLPFWHHGHAWSICLDACLCREGVDARNEVAQESFLDMLSWMDQGGQVGVFDATNSTRERRTMLLQLAENRCKVIFLECLCNDDSIIDRNAREKIRSSPDYASRSGSGLGPGSLLPEASQGETISFRHALPALASLVSHRCRVLSCLCCQHSTGQHSTPQQRTRRRGPCRHACSILRYSHLTHVSTT